jgi:MFS family permease
MTIVSHPPALTDAQRWRSILAVAMAMLGAGLTFGMSGPLLSFVLDARGVESSVIGINAALGSVGIFVAGILTPLIAHRFGGFRTLCVGMAASAALLIGYTLTDALPVWFALRFASGFCSGLFWIVAETWVNRVATEEQRGRMVSLYATAFALGIAIGPQVLVMTGIEGARPFIVGAVLMAAGLVPILMARGTAPADIKEKPKVSVGPVVRLAPFIFAAAFVSGSQEMSVLALLPVYGTELGFAQGATALALTAFAGGGVVAQYPLGWLADRMSRVTLLVVVTLAAIAGAAAMPFLSGQSLWIVAPIVFLWGAAVMGFYTLGLILMGQRFGSDQLTAANAAFIMCYTLGGSSGPPLSGLAMDVVPPNGFVIALIVILVAFLALSLAQARRLTVK